jgi:hypothetical protein
MRLSPFWYTHRGRLAEFEVSMRNRELRVFVCLFLSGVCACAQAVAPESSGQWTGTASAIIEDDFINGRSRTVWELATEEGTFEMHFAGRAPRASGSNVIIQGVRSGERIAVARIVDEAAATSPQCTTTGPQKIAVLMMTTPGNPDFPAEYTPAAVYEKFFGPATGDLRTESVSSLWQQMSDGRTSATGEVFGPFRLDQDFTCEDRSALRAAAISAAEPTVDFTEFSRIALLYPVGSCSSYTGMSTIGCTIVSTPSQGNLFESVAWLAVVHPYNQLSTSVGFYTHELGHSLGLGHASSDDYGGVPLGPLADPGTVDVYGDLFSNMGDCCRSTYNGLPYTGQYSAQHKRLLLNWLLPSSVQEVQTSGTFNVAPFESSSGVRALRILRDAASGAWLWAEFRNPTGSIDGSLSIWGTLAPNNIYNGALIHYEDPELDPSRTYLLKFNRSTSTYAFLNATLEPWQTWSDPYSLLTLRVTNANWSGLSMTVDYDQPCATLTLSSTVFPAIGGSGSITVSAPPTCSWTASTPADWIMLTGATYGQGDGMVNFTVSPTSSFRQRGGYITVQRQSSRIVQTGSGASVISATPVSGRGSSGQFTFEFSHEEGYSSLSDLQVEFSDFGGVSFGGLPDCKIQAHPTEGLLWLRDNPVGKWLGPISISAPGQSLSNGACSVYSTGSSVSGSGNRLTLMLQVRFPPSFAGTHRVVGWAYGSGGSTAYIPLGIWTVVATTPPSRSLPPRGQRSAIPD